MSSRIKYCFCGTRAHGYGLCRTHYQDKYRDSQDHRYFTSPKGRYQVLKHNARIKNREVGITFEEFSELLVESDNKCFYCQGPLGRGSASDRVDNALGYVRGNIVICCDGCNKLKSNLLSQEETLKLVQYLKELRATAMLWAEAK
jgi:hypothetical protein